MSNYITLDPINTPGVYTTGQGLVKAWVNGVELEPEAAKQLVLASQLPFIHRWIAAMPDTHHGAGATVGSVIPTKKAIIPAAVGVDIGCGMVAIRTSLTAENLPDNLRDLRLAIEQGVPHGGPGITGTWAEQGRHGPPSSVMTTYGAIAQGYKRIIDKNPKVVGREDTNLKQLGTLGGGNHFIEVCLDEAGQVWVMLHSGSRGVGNKIGTYFIDKAKEAMVQQGVHLVDKNLAYLTDDTQAFEDYWEAVQWCQDYARLNRSNMLRQTLGAMANTLTVPFTTTAEEVQCHHNYVGKETHYGEEVYVTRKGAISARAGQLGIIPGSMGTRSYIVEGLGSEESYHSASHGAGRRMSRTEAKRVFTVEDHIAATEGVECRKDAGVLDETPGAYKDIDQVIEAEKDLVRVKHTLKAVLCVKG